MKVCITAKGPDLESRVDPRFGRCAYFIVMETNGGGFEVFPNTHAAAPGGAGIKSGQFAYEKGAEAVITGSVGPNAYNTLEAAEIEVMTGAAGNVREVIEQFKAGELEAARSHTVESHHGMKD